MTYVPQIQLDALKKGVSPGKVMILYGPRRTGKTTILEHYLEEKEDALFVSGDDFQVQGYLSSGSVSRLGDFIGNHKLLVIDEAQNVEQIGLNLKLIVDHFPDVSVIATGSSSFELANQVGEPLTGRRKVLRLFPLSQIELCQIEKRHESEANLEKRLVFGSYPESVLLPSDEERREYLHELVQSYLYKDILEVDGVKKAKKVIQLLQLLAHQIGKEVSHTELGATLGLNKGTVERYLDLLEKVFVVVNIRGFSRNLRKEVTRTSKYYFYDLGIRNALINNFNFLSMRDDVGDLWENYLVMERLKKQEYQKIYANNYFWRTYNQKELDWLEERDGKLFGYEFKWKAKKVKAPKLWLETYPEALFECVNRENYFSFIT